jgi:uncharacterized membrane protein YedE/YeeE
MNRLGFLIGVAFGFLLAAARLNEYNTIHRMLLLRDPQPFLIMGSAVAVAAPLLWLLRRRRWRTPLGGALTVSRSRVERKHILGAMVFGTGWAVAGTCPGPAIAMAAGGGLLGLVVMGGLFTGLSLRDKVTAARERAPRPERLDAKPAAAGN